MAMSISDVDNRTGGVRLQIGQQWKSFEQFRKDGQFKIRQVITEGTIGSVRIGDTEFILLRRVDFNRLHGMATEVRRLSRGVVLLRQAVEMVLRNRDEEMAFTHLKDLTMEFTLPSTTTAMTGDLE